MIFGNRPDPFKRYEQEAFEKEMVTQAGNIGTQRAKIKAEKEIKRMRESNVIGNSWLDKLANSFQGMVRNVGSNSTDLEVVSEKKKNHGGG